MENSYRPLDVIVVGELNVDIILNDMEQLPSIGKEIIANEMVITLGSSSAIFASNLSSLKAKVAFIGKTGKDNFGQFVLESLENKNVDTSHVLKSDTLSTGITMVLNYDQDRANVTYPGAMDELSISEIDTIFLSKAKHLHLSSCFIQPGLKNDLPKLFQKAKQLGLTTSLDPQWDPKEEWELPLEELIPFVDVFMPNGRELKGITQGDSIEEGIERLSSLSNIVIVKKGNEGAWAWNGKEVIKQPAFLNSNVVDCVGAGDSFNAGFIYQFTQNAPLTKCLEFGSLMGAINTTRPGGTGAFESRILVEKIAREVFNYNF